MVNAFAVKGDYTLNRNKVKEIETLISKLPKIKSDLDSDATLDANIDWIVEELIEMKNFEKMLKKSICFGVDTKSDCLGVSLPISYKSIGFKKINDLKKLNPTQLKKQITRVENELKKNEIIFNKF